MDPRTQVPGARPVVVAITGALLALGLVAAPAAVAASYRDCSDIVIEPGADATRCDLPGLVIIGQSLPGIDFSRANLADLVAGCDPDEPQTNLTGARFTRAVMTDALLCDAILTDADLRGADLTGGALEDATLNGANLARADLSGAHAHFSAFAGASLFRATWTSGTATATNFSDADLRGLDWRGTNATSALLIDADLRRAQLAGVNFTNADLTGADLGGATGLDGVTWSNTTCPDGSNSNDLGGTCFPT